MTVAMWRPPDRESDCASGASRGAAGQVKKRLTANILRLRPGSRQGGAS